MINSDAPHAFTKDVLYISATAIPIALISGATPFAIPAFMYAASALFFLQQKHSPKSDFNQIHKETAQIHCPIFNDCAKAMKLGHIPLHETFPSEKAIASARFKSVHINEKAILLLNVSDAEKRSIYAHELSHIKNDDLAREGHIRATRTAYRSAYLMGVFSLNFGLVGLALAGSLFDVLVNRKYSRSVEKRADRHSLEATRDLQPAISWMERLIPISNKTDKSIKDMMTTTILNALETHPTKETRVQNIKNHAKKLGLTQ